VDKCVIDTVSNVCVISGRVFLCKYKVISPTARLDKIPGIGPATTEKLLSLGLLTVLDLLRILPRAWDDLTQLHQIQDLQPNGQKYTIKATLENPKMFRTSRRRMVLTQATAHDDTGSVDRSEEH